jgi:hypothetical protein
MTRDDTDTVLSQEDGTRDGRPNLAPGIRTHLGEHLRTSGSARRRCRPASPI